MWCASIHLSYPNGRTHVNTMNFQSANPTKIRLTSSILEINSNKTFIILLGMNRVRQGRGWGPGGAG